MSYTDVFGGNTIYPSDVSLLHLHFDEILDDVRLEWPLEISGTAFPLARIIETHPDMEGRKVTLPDATHASPGETVLFNNFNSLYSFEVRDFAGSIIATIPPGTTWEIYLAHNDTPQGVWFAFQFGASTATVQPSALAGFGLTVTGTTLSVATPVINFSTSGTTVAASNRATAFIWQGTGSGTLNMLTAASAGNNFIFHVRNDGGGDLTLDPAGTETINNLPTLLLHPGDSASVVTDGTAWYTIGLGQDPVFAFDYTSINVAPGGTYTLAPTEQNRIAYKFTGALTSDVTVALPPTVQQYWVTNATTGPFRLFLDTAAGTPVQVNQGAKGIYYVDNVGGIILASDPTSIGIPVVISDGGTGATTASAARLNLGISALIDPFVIATTTAAARTVIEAAKAGANNDITSLAALTSVTVTGNETISGRLGIGTLSPAVDLDISKSVPGGFVGASIANTATGAAVQSRLTLATGTPNAYVISAVLDNAGAPFYQIVGGAGVPSAYHDFNTHIWRNSGGGEEMRLTSGGNLGVGTASPIARVHAQVADGQAAFGASGATKGMRVIVSATHTSIEGVDNTLTGSFQPLQMTGSEVVLGVSPTNQYLKLYANGDVGINDSAPGNKLSVLTATDGAGISIKMAAASTGTSGPQLSMFAWNNSSALAPVGAIKAMMTNGTPGSSASDLVFYTTVAGNFIESMRLTSGGNLALGGAVGAFRLHAKGSGDIFRITTTTARGSGQCYMSFADPSGRKGFVGYASDDNLVVQNDIGAGVLFSTSGAVRGGFTNIGWFGVGTASPAAMLHVNDGDESARFQGSNANTEYITFHDNSGRLGYRGWVSTTDCVHANERVGGHNFIAGGNTPCRMFANNHTGFNVGDLGAIVNVQSPAGTNGIHFNHLSGATSFCWFMVNGANVGSIQTNGSTTSFNTTSDKRLKTNIQPAADPGPLIDALNIVQFDWTTGDQSHVPYGLIAQEAVAQIAHAIDVGTDDVTAPVGAIDPTPDILDADGNVAIPGMPGEPGLPGGELAHPWGVDYGKLVPLLLKEIQSLRARVAALEAA